MTTNSQDSMQGCVIKNIEIVVGKLPDKLNSEEPVCIRVYFPSNNTVSIVGTWRINKIEKGYSFTFTSKKGAMRISRILGIGKKEGIEVMGNVANEVASKMLKLFGSQRFENPDLGLPFTVSRWTRKRGI